MKMKEKRVKKDIHIISTYSLLRNFNFWLCLYIFSLSFYSNLKKNAAKNLPNIDCANSVLREAF